MLGVHAADEAELVGDAGRVWQHLRDIHAALAVLTEFERARQERIDVVGLVDFDAAGKRLPGQPREHRLGIEQVHLAGTAVLHQLNDGLGLGGEVRAAGFEIVVSGRSVQEIGEDEVTEAEAGSLEQLTAGEGGHGGRFTFIILLTASLLPGSLTSLVRGRLSHQRFRWCSTPDDVRAVIAPTGRT